LDQIMFTERGWRLSDDMRRCDLVHFTGGSDVSPSLYGQARHHRTSVNPLRDKKEKAVFHEALDRDLPMVGECRGGQFLNVMSGGSMYQHVDGHAEGGSHSMVELATGDMFPVTSTHHQMMMPSSLGEVLAVASESSVYEYMDGGSIRKYIPDRGEDVEVVYYPRTNALCYQGHPEYVGKDHPCQEYFFRLIEEKLYESN